MTATGPRTRAKSGAKRSPRRLSRDARRDQLIDVAMPLVAEHGLSGFSLDELAQRADVTRNLLYHYFPRGRLDVFLAEQVGREIAALVEKPGEGLNGERRRWKL